MATNITNATIAQYMATVPSLMEEGGAARAQIAAHKAAINTAIKSPTPVSHVLASTKAIRDYQQQGNYGLQSKASPTNIQGSTTSQGALSSGGAGTTGAAFGAKTSSEQRNLIGRKSYASKSTGSGIKIGGSSGAISNDGNAIPSAYMIKISSQSMGHTVTAVLQQEIGLRTSSEWETFLPIGNITQAVNSLSQSIFGVSLQTRFSTRRIWKGTSPLEISLTFKFESIDNTYRNVVLPCEALMMMASPYSIPGPLPFLAPPGPSPFKVTGLANAVASNPLTRGAAGAARFIEEHIGEGDNIIINLGDFLEFSSVIIKDVQPVFSARMDTNGLPISATCTIVFESYEIMTRSAIQKAFVNKAG